MFDPEHVERLLAGVPAWNEWRKASPDIVPKLAEADLRKANLGQANLCNARLHGANLQGANLHSAQLEEARLGEANLRNANLTQANLTRADLREANLSSASLYGVYASGARFTGANLQGANLQGSELRHCDLEGANLSRVLARMVGFSGSFKGANLKGANLSGAELIERDMSEADLRGANLSDAVMIGADLRGARLDRSIMIDTNLRSADLTGASIYGVSAWNVQLEDATQLDLVIRRNDEDTAFTLDDLEVAQFIYMMMDNQRVRRVIDTITSKVVLILGRFGTERKSILDGLREELRKRNYLPIIFDFEKPDNRDLTETIGTLAHMARFVIADLTDAKSLPQELESFVPGLPSVPVQPILLSGTKEYAMFEHFARYESVLPIVEYPDLEVLLGALQEMIIAPAEEKARQQIAVKAKPRVVLGK